MTNTKRAFASGRIIKRDGVVVSSTIYLSKGVI